MSEYYDTFTVDGQLWGFKGNDVMPTPVPGQQPKSIRLTLESLGDDPVEAQQIQRAYEIRRARERCLEEDWRIASWRDDRYRISEEDLEAIRIPELQERRVPINSEPVNFNATGTFKVHRPFCPVGSQWLQPDGSILEILGHELDCIRTNSRMNPRFTVQAFQEWVNRGQLKRLPMLFVAHNHRVYEQCLQVNYISRDGAYYCTGPESFRSRSRGQKVFVVGTPQPWFWECESLLEEMGLVVEYLDEL